MPDGARLVGPTTFSIRKPTKKQLEKILPGAKYIAPDELMNADIRGPVVIGAYHGTTYCQSSNSPMSGQSLKTTWGLACMPPLPLKMSTPIMRARARPNAAHRTDKRAVGERRHGRRRGGTRGAKHAERSWRRGDSFVATNAQTLLFCGKAASATRANKGTFIEFRGDVEQYRDEAEELVMDREELHATNCRTIRSKCKMPCMKSKLKRL